MWEPVFNIDKYAVAEGRNCEGCAMCCYLPKIEEMNKPQNQWCKHCSTKNACDEYEQRPNECRDFFCHFMTDLALGENWKPSKSKLLLVLNQQGDRLTVFVDPMRPDAWLKETYYSQLNAWSVSAVAQRCQVIVDVGGSKFIIFPDRHKALGNVKSNQIIVTTEETTPYGIKLDAYVSEKQQD